MYSTINSYRNDTNREALATLAAERRLARSTERRAPKATPVARSLVASHQAALAVLAALVLLVAIAVPVLTAPLV